MKNNKNEAKSENESKMKRNSYSKNVLKSNNAITLVVLVITIIVLIILAGIGISLLFEDNNIIDKTKQAKFVSQFSEVEEKVLLYMSNKKIEEVVQNLNLTQEEKLPLGVLADKSTFKDTLKEEIEQTSGESIENLDIYYIDKEKVNTKVEHTYILDIKNMQIYDADGEEFSGKWHHTLRQIEIQGKPDVVDDIPSITTEEDIGWYAPNVDGFSGSYTFLVYYNIGNYNEKKEVPVKEYIEGGKKNKIQENGKNYVLDNYKDKQWANVKTNANGIESWWVWIPRYAYAIDSTNKKTDVIFIDLENKPIGNKYETLPENYIVHPGFTKTNVNDKGETVVLKELQGIWMSKYEPSNTSNANHNMDTGMCYEPDMSGFDKNYTYIELYDAASKNFNEEKLLKTTDLKTVNNDNKWYDYGKKQWANVKTNANGLECWWVWIPRYAYCINQGVGEMDIIFIDLNNKPIDTVNCGKTLPDNFIVHPTFTVTNENGTVRELKGIWMSKYEPSNVADTIGGTVATGASTLPKATDQSGTTHTHIPNGCGTKERFVTNSTKWCTGYDGTPCSNYGYYIYCSECGVRLRHYWCKNHVNKATKVIINDENVE